MTALDGLLLLLLGGGMVQGYASGFFKQVASIAGMVVGLAFGLALMTEAGMAVARSLGVSPRVAPVVGFMLVFGVVQLGMFALARVAEGVLGIFKLGVLNRLTGAALGGLKAALLISILLIPLGMVGVPRAATREASRLYAPIAATMPFVWGHAARYIPRIDGLREQFDAAARTLRHRLTGDASDPS